MTEVNVQLVDNEVVLTVESGSPDTAAQILAKLLTVDGPGSLLDADLLDGIHAAGFDLAGAAAAAQAAAIAASQPVNAQLTAIALLTTTAYGRSLLELANAAAGRTALGLGTVSTLASDTDGTLAANSDAVVATQKAVKTYADQLIASADAMVYKGVIDCSANPNYPAADAGWTYKISVAGKIGGAAGLNVEVGDLILCAVDGSAAGDQAAVGVNWSVVQVNIDGAVTGPASSVSGRVATFSGVSGKVIQDGGTALADLLTSAAAAATYATQAAAVLQATVDAKGDTLVATAADTVTRKAAPANGKFSVADSAQAVGWLDIDLPWMWTHLPWNGYFSTTTATVFTTVDSAALGCGTLRTTNLINEEMVWKVPLGVGTWTCMLTTFTNSNNGILTCTLNGTSVGTVDLYSASIARNVQTSITGISVATAGVYSFKVAALTKNTSSSSYVSNIQAITWIRTA